MKLYRSLHICVSIYRLKLTETYHVFIFFNKSIKIQKIICESSMLLPFPYMWGWYRQCACTTVHTWKPEDSLRGDFSPPCAGISGTFTSRVISRTPVAWAKSFCTAKSFSSLSLELWKYFLSTTFKIVSSQDKFRE